MMTKTVLLVEDYQNDVLLIQRFWKSEDVKAPLMVVTDGRKAVDYLSGNGECSDREEYPLPCLVLMDLKLQYLMGLEVLKWIREQPGLRALPVIVLSTSALQHDIDEAYQHGANAFIVKPSGILGLAEIVIQIRDFWLRTNHLPRVEWQVPEQIVRATPDESAPCSRRQEGFDGIENGPLTVP